MAQTSPAIDIAAKYKSHVLTTSAEKLFVHTDKTFYLAGELMWFKLYNIGGPKDLSKVAYVEVLDKENQSVLQAKIALQEGNGQGSFYLPVTLSSGNYKIRAYTNWLKNFGPEFFFEKNISIVNSLVESQATAIVKPQYDAQFFPEGGNRLRGVESKVAFRVVDQNGKGVNFRGAILDEKNEIIANFEPLKFGIGHFSFIPKGMSYQALIQINNGPSLTVKLPQVYEQGYTLKVLDPADNQINVQVQARGISSNSSVYLLIHSGQQVSLAETQRMNNGQAVFTVDKSLLPQGVSYFTVFNEDKKPIAERLFFKRPEEKFLIESKTDQQTYDLRSPINLSLKTLNDSYQPVKANLSLSVYKLDSLQTEESTHIYNYFWLGSQLKGNIESADYYLNNSDLEADQAVDNLMLTHGWSRFKWEEILGASKPQKFLPEYEGHLISGRIIDRASNPLNEALVYLSIPAKQGLYGAKNKQGELLFNTRNLYGNHEIVAQTHKDSLARVEIHSPFAIEFSSIKIPELEMSEKFTQSLLSRNLGMQVQNLYLKDKIKQLYDPVKDGSVFYGSPDKSYLLDDYTRFSTLEEVLREYVIDASVRKLRDGFHLKVFDAPRQVFFDEDPLALIDGVPVQDFNKLLAIDPLRLKKLDVISGRYVLGPNIANGILSFSTYKGDFLGEGMDLNALVMEYEGLQLQRDFFSPVYQTEAQKSSRMPDFRNVLHWLPNINSLGEERINFYSSDLPGQYIVVIQGLDAQGNPGFKTVYFRVGGNNGAD
ncbi:MAG TPA: hypothetical protein VEV16_11165 [Daejeonella sp.]|nr:hypothetical protein [Daejeonella sp.]